MSGARSRLRSRRAKSSTDPQSIDFGTVVPRLSPHLSHPYWLAPLADVIKRSFTASAGLGPPVFACVSVPPQHGKTLQIQHAVAGWLEARPQDPILYATYNKDVAREKSRETRDLARIAGVPLRADSRSLNTWTTDRGGGFRARALVGGSLTGMPGLRWVIIDDPYKGRAEAESPAYRNAVWASFSGNVVSRLHPGTSILVNHTRWHEDDLIGRLKKEQPDQWEFHNLEAVNAADEALWPEGQPRDLLRMKREMGGEYDWWSLYMGQPRPRGGKVFQGVQYFDVLPEHRHVAIGVDLSYSGKTSSDWSVAVVMAESHGRYYVLDVVRRQVPATVFAADVAQLQRSYPGATTRMYASSEDWEQIEVMRKLGADIVGIQATRDKFIRAQGLSAAWNAHPETGAPGRVYLRSGATWLGQYTSVLMDFTGRGDRHDDDVDASAAAYDALPHGPVEAVDPEKLREVVAQRPPRDPAITVRGRGRLGSW